MITLVLVLPTILLAQGSSLGRVGRTDLNIVEHWNEEGEPSLDLIGEWNDNSRIVSGSRANDGEVPYQASVQAAANGKHFCGGSIVNELWILTAAHCTHGVKPKQLQIAVGLNKLSSGGTVYKCVHITNHKDYNASSLEYDIAVLKVDKEIEFSERVAAIDLADTDPPVGSTLLISGWGELWYNGVKPDNLMWLNTTLISIEECKKDHKYTGDKGKNIKKGNQVCTKLKRQGACEGDSGGPLVFKDGGKTEQVGVVSWGTPCAVGLPDVFMSVSGFRDWILDNTKVD